MLLETMDTILGITLLFTPLLTCYGGIPGFLTSIIINLLLFITDPLLASQSSDEAVKQTLYYILWMNTGIMGLNTTIFVFRTLRKYFSRHPLGLDDY